MRRGFTLVEMLVVLVVIGLIVSLAPAAFERLLPGRRLDAAARELADTLRTSVPALPVSMGRGPASSSPTRSA